jgi:biotin/methionine sulfoxide reductase
MIQCRGAKPITHSSHWGAFTIHHVDGDIEIVPHREDPDPSPILENIPGARTHGSRIRYPAVRKAWLEGGPGHSAENRGHDEFVQLPWDDVLDLAAGELERVTDLHTPEAIFGGSYGWSSAGRFHHAQSQVHRFLNTVLGGYTRSTNTYSAGASAVILPHIVGPIVDICHREATWSEIAQDSELVVAFGGLSTKNAAVSAGGITHHIAKPSMIEARQRGADFVLVSPIEDDLPKEVLTDWLALRPNTDVALMLGLAYTLYTERLFDRDFISRYCEGFDQFVDYLVGRTDGQKKDAAWASAICEIPAATIHALARRMASCRTILTLSHSLQRSEYGEQPVWMGLTLAAMLGQIGTIGGGFAYSVGAIGNVGKSALDVPIPTLPQCENGVSSYIPVARISDMLLHPGELFDYNGQRLTYPDIRLVYWAGGNPFHHHQDINRLRKAFARPETIIVHDAFWTATARHADIVLPATMTIERDDIGASTNDPKLIAMKSAYKPYGSAQDDFEIFNALAARLGKRDRFSEGRTNKQWLEFLYEPTRRALADKGLSAPSFGEFWERGELDLPVGSAPGMLRQFVKNPVDCPLPTPSGRIEISSERIESFGYQDCPGHPTWMEPEEWLGSPRTSKFPLQLVANQPKNRLHSQLDFGVKSQELKVAGREPVRIHPDDASKRNITDGDIVRLYNDRGACLAGAVVSNAVRQGVVQLSTGAWYSPADHSDPFALCRHGNPNVLTRDFGTSKLAQGCTGQLSLVEIERYLENVPAEDFYNAPTTNLGSV